VAEADRQATHTSEVVARAPIFPWTRRACLEAWATACINSLSGESSQSASRTIAEPPLRGLVRQLCYAKCFPLCPKRSGSALPNVQCALWQDLVAGAATPIRLIFQASMSGDGSESGSGIGVVLRSYQRSAFLRLRMPMRFGSQGCIQRERKGLKLLRCTCMNWMVAVKSAIKNFLSGGFGGKLTFKQLRPQGACGA
jgi:hypothetical protein